MSVVLDRRRFQGPDSSTALRRPLPEPVAPLASTSKREDGRAADRIRPIYLQVGLIPHASGSAFIETGKTKVVCAVYGPHPARRDAHFSSKARLNVEVRFAPFACRSARRPPGRDAEAPDLAAQVFQSLIPAICSDRMPKSVIDVFVTIIECDGPEHDASLAVTAASVALADAGIEMVGLVVGMCAGITRQPAIWLDPTYSEHHACVNGLLRLASMPALGTTTFVAFEGQLERRELKQAIEQLKDISGQIHQVVASRLSESSPLVPHDAKPV